MKKNDGSGVGANSNVRHFLSITDLSKDEIYEVLEEAKRLKAELKQSGSNEEMLKNKTMIMIFEKPSLRTRISFEAGMTQLGGHAIYLGPSDIGMGSREEPRDIAIVSSRMSDIIMARTFKHQTIQDLAKYSLVPVINALSDREHPCQILADLLTIQEHKGNLEGLTLAFVGDADNNVTHSLALACEMLGMNFRVGAPQGYWMNSEIAQKVEKCLFQTDDPASAVQGADVVITDTWVSMGDEAEKAKRLEIFPKYRVDAGLMGQAKSDAIFMHCLPAYRDHEVAGEVIDGPQSVAFDEAENRLHAQKGLISFLMK